MNRTRLVALALALAVLAAFSGPAHATPSGSSRRIRDITWKGSRLSAVTDELIVRWKQDTPATARDRVRRGLGLERRRGLRSAGAELLKLGGGDLEAVLGALADDPLVEWVEPNGIVRAVTYPVPDDPYYQGTRMPAQTYLGQIKADKAWNDPSVTGSKGDPSVIVAVIDTGVDYAHPDFDLGGGQSRILTAPAGPGPPLGGGFVVGTDVFWGDDDPMDDNMHGTMVAGLIGAAADNARGIAGVTWEPKIMPVKVLGPEGWGSWSDLITALEFAKDHGARIVNMSLGGPAGSLGLHEAVRATASAGIVLVAAAGNDAGPVNYPGAYPEIIAVGSVNGQDQLSDFSCFGPELALVAPGEGTPGLISTYPGGTYNAANGTSFASPLTAGVAALAVSQNPDWAPETVRRRLTGTADKVPPPSGFFYGASGFELHMGYGRLNAYQVLGGLGHTPSYYASAYLYNSVTALFPAAGADPCMRHEFPASGAGSAVFWLATLDPEYVVSSGYVAVWRSDGLDQSIDLDFDWTGMDEWVYSATLFVDPNNGYDPVVCVPDAYLSEWGSTVPLWIPLPAFTIPGLSPASLEVTASPNPNETGLVTALRIVARDGAGSAIRGVPIRAVIMSAPGPALLGPPTGTTAGSQPGFDTSLTLSTSPGNHLVVVRVDDPRFQNISATITVTGVPRLYLHKRVEPAPYACAGRALEYTISWSKGGWTTAFALTITDTLPNGTRFSSAAPGLFAQDDALGTPVLSASSWASAAAGPWTPGFPPEGAAPPLLLRWVVDRAAPGRSGSIGYRVEISSTLAQGSLVRNRASATFMGEGRPAPTEAVATVVDDPSPLATHAAAPASVSSGQTIDVTLTVTNTGAGSFIASPAIGVVPAAGLVTPVWGPLPVPPVSIPPGASQSFTWRFSTAGAGRAVFSAAVAGGACDGDSAATLVEAPAGLDSRFAAVPGPVSLGQVFLVTLTVTNTGVANLAGLATEPVLLAGGGGAGLVDGPWPAPPVALPGGASIVFTWTYTATVAGTVLVSTTVAATDANSGDAVTGLPTGVLVVQQPAVLTGSPLTAVPDPVCGGNVITMSATVINTGEAAAIDVGSAALALAGTGAAEFVSGPAAVARLAGGESACLAWVYRATAGGGISFTATVTGLDENSRNQLSTGPLSSAEITVLASQWLIGSLALPPGACIGHWLEVALTVTNTAAFPIPGAVPDLAVLDGAGIVEPIEGPVPAGPVTIPAGGSQVFRWTLSVSGQGTPALTGRAQAPDPVSGCILVAAPSGTVTTGAAGQLASSLTASPSTAGIGQPIAVVLEASNTGSIVLTGVGPALECRPVGGPASYVSGPSPAGPVILAPGASISFTWVYHADSAGSVVFTGTVTGTDECLGVLVSARNAGVTVATAMAVSRCPPDTGWSVDYDSPASGSDEAKGVATDGAGNVVVAGTRGGDWEIRKYSPAGSFLWEASYGSPAGGFDSASAVAVDGGGSIVVAGYAMRSDLLPGGYDWLVRKYDPGGVLIWSRTHSGPVFAGNDQATGIAVDSAGNILVAGYEYRADLSQYNNWLVRKYDSDGGLVWSRSHNGPAANGDDRATGIAVDSAGNVVVAGYEIRTDLFQGYNWLIRKYDPDGTLVWSRSYDSPYHGDDQANGVAVDSGGNIVVAGYETRWDLGQSYNWLVRKYDPAGDLLWAKSYNDPGNGYDEATGVAVDVAGNIAVCGAEYITQYAWRLALYSPGGDELWSEGYSSPAQSDDEATGVAVDPAGNIIEAGYENRSDLGQWDNWRVIKYRPTAGCLLATLSLSPLNPGLGSVVVAELAVENPGTGNVTGVTPALWVSRNPLAVQPLLGPVPAGPVTLGPGASQTFTWTLSVTGVGLIELTGTASGTDELTGAPRSGADFGMLDVPCSFTNGILTVECVGESEDNYGIGQFTVRTGADHPHPGKNVLYPSPSTTFFSLRDVTGSVLWTNSEGLPTDLGGFDADRMSGYPATLTALGSKEFRVTYNLPEYIVTEDVAISGSVLADSKVRHTVSVTNTTTGARQYGVRIMWDWMIADSDDSWFRPRDPDGTFTDIFCTFTPPVFPRYEQVDFPASPTFSVFGSVTGCDQARPATQPEELRYSSWGIADGKGWDFVNTGSGSDSAMVYYWGKNTPLTIGPGETASFTQYVTTELGALQSTVSLYKDSTPDGAVVDGGELMYTVSWNTTGGDTVYGLTITDTLPALTRYRSPSFEFWAQPDDLGTPSLAWTAWGPTVNGPWTAGEPADLAGPPLFLKWSVDRAAPGRTGFIRFRVAVSATAFEPAAVIANSASATVYLSAKTSYSNEVVNPVGVDVRLTKTPSGWTLSRGMPLTYTIEYANVGAMTATQVSLWDTLPPGADFLGCTGGLSCTIHDGVVVWTLPPNLEPGSSGTVSVTASANGTGLTLGPNVARFGYRDVAGKTGPEELSNPVSVFIVTPHVTLAKFAGAERVPDGGLLDYYLQVTNSGTDPARNFTIWDTLPPGAGFVACSGGSSCGFDGTKVVFTVDRLSPGAARTLVITVSATGGLNGEFNRGLATFVDSATQWLGPITSNPVSVGVDPGAVLLVKEADPPDAVPAGGEIAYTIRWTNTAEGIVRNMVFTDTLPGGVEYAAPSLTAVLYPDWAGTPALTGVAHAASAAGPWTDGEPADGTGPPLVLRWTVDRVYPAASGYLQFRVRTSATLADGTVVCNATSATVMFDPRPHEAGSVCTTVRQTSLALLKKASATLVPDGTLVTYTIQCLNNSSDTATGIVLLDTLPSGAVYDQCGGSCGFDGTRVSWTVPDLSPGQTAYVWFTATITAPTSPNLAMVWFANMEGVPGSAISNPVTVAVDPGAVLLAKEAGSRDWVPAGGEVTYTIRWTNTSAGVVRGLTLTDTLPAGTRYLAPSLTAVLYPDSAGTPTLAGLAYATSAGGPWTDGEPADGTGPPLILRWTIDRVYPAASGYLQFRVRTSATLADGAVLCNAASATILFDPRPRETASACTAIRRAALVLTKTASGAVVPDGSLVTYTVRYFNSGSDTATGIALLDTLPSGAVYDHCGGSCGFDGTRVSWTVPDLSPGQTGYVWFTATITAPTSPNLAMVWFANTEGAPGSAISNPVTVGIKRPLLSLRKDASVSPACDGGVLVFGFSLTNTGTDTAFSVTLTDALPAGAAYGGCAGGSGCAFDGTSVGWTIPNLPPGAAAALSLTVTVAGALGINTARADCSNGAAVAQPPAWSNPCAVGVVQARMILGVVPDAACASSEGNLTYFLTCTNTGTATVANLRVWDTLPAGTTWVGGGTLSGAVVSWMLPPMPPGGHGTVFLIVKPAAPCSTIMLSDAAGLSFDNACGAHEPPVFATAPPVELRNAGIVLGKHASRSEVEVGETVTYVIDFANQCQDTAVALTVWDTLPAGSAFAGCSGGSGCGFDGTKVEWPLGDLPPGGTGSLTLTVTVAGRPLADNVAMAAIRAGLSGAYREVASNPVHVEVPEPPPPPPPPSFCGVPFRVYPNPYNPGTAVRGTLKFQGLPRDGTIRVYTLRGLLVWSARPAPDCSAEWNGTNSAGRRVAPGVFFWVVEGPGFRNQGRLIVE